MMKKKSNLAKLMALLMTVSLAGSSVSVYAETDGNVQEQASEKTKEGKEAEDHDKEAQEIAISDHETHKLDKGTVVEPTCTEKGYTLFKCTLEGCTYEEKKDEKNPLGHDMKEISRTEATKEEPAKITYECQREGCSYQETVEMAEHPEDQEKDPTPAPQPSVEPSEEPKEDPVPTEKPEAKPTEIPTQTPVPETKTETDTEELPEVDPDTEDEALTYSSVTSTDITTEYDPETAYDTLKGVRKPDTPEVTEDIEGRTVPADMIDITRDENGNLTDLALSAELEEIRNGFSVISESGTLKSISIVNKVDPGAYWITLKSKEPAKQMGICLEETDTGLTVSLTENKESLYITEISENEKNIILHTSAGGICEIRNDTGKFTTDKLSESENHMDHILFNELKSEKSKISFSTSDPEEKSDAEKEKFKEKDYWMLPYNERGQEPVILTVYEKIQDIY